MSRRDRTSSLQVNWSFFRSWHAVSAGVVIGAVFVARWVSSPHSLSQQRALLLATGVVTFTLFLLAATYAMRKYAHKMGISPEFKMRVRELERIERSESRLNELRLQILRGEFGSAAEVEKRAQAILREEGVHRINRVRVSAGGSGGSAFELTVVPTQPLAPMARWTRFHLFYGIAVAFVLSQHSGFTFDTPMALLLNGLSSIVLVTGAYGIVVWAIGPSWLTRCERDLTSEEAFVLERSLSSKLTEALEELTEPDRELLSPLLRARSGVPERLATLRAHESFPRLRDLAVLIQQRQRARDTLRSLNRVRYAIHGWKWLHVPAAVVLLWVAFLHVLSVIWY